VKLGAQNAFYETKGAFTGATSAPMLKSVGCQYVLVGHSERRKVSFILFYIQVLGYI
jgi:triosephosphate isomerase